MMSGGMETAGYWRDCHAASVTYLTIHNLPFTIFQSDTPMVTTFDGARFLDQTRRGELQKHPTLNGIDFLEVVVAPEADNQRVLTIHFLPASSPATSAKLDALLAQLDGRPERCQISGGVRVTAIRVLSAARAGDALSLRVDLPGDFSTYTLTIQSALLDDFFRQIDFSFKAGCPSRFDCRPRPYCPPDLLTGPAIDYMAKDYASFRQALIDLIPTLSPGWSERRSADFAMTMLELLAYVGDQLSYYQDAVANEAYLETARQRISVRRHARLIDYAMHDGLSASTFAHFVVAGGASPTVSGECVIQLLTKPTAIPLDGPAIPPERAAPALAAAEAVFEVLLAEGETLHFSDRLNEIRLYTWGHREVYLPGGATSATLEGDLAFNPSDGVRVEPWRLKAGDFLLFEEVKGPEEGKEADADPTHRQVVRLTAAEARRDDLLGKDLTHVEWDAADALRFPLCVAGLSKHAGVPLTDISVARGNLALAVHGRTLEEWHPRQPPLAGESGVLGVQPGSRPYRFLLQQPGLSQHPAVSGARPSVSALRAATAAGARPGVLRLSEHIPPRVQPNKWSIALPDLLASGRFARDATVESDNLRRGLLRFGDGQFGRLPTRNAFFHVTYRVGVGAAGNIGADSLTHFMSQVIRPGPNDRSLVAAPLSPDIRAVRNPVAAWGGAEPEPMEQVKAIAPAAFQAEQYRAVTEQDYADIAMRHPSVHHATARFRWTGSWRTVFISVDLAQGAALTPEMEASIAAWVARHRLAGYDVEIAPPIYIPLAIDVEACASPGYFSGDVEQALLERLDSRIHADGSRGFFHPDHFTFGQPLYLSQLYAAVASVPGVQSAAITAFARRYDPDPPPQRPITRRNLENGLIAVGALEIVRLDNDPSQPENGILQVNVRGGA